MAGNGIEPLSSRCKRVALPLKLTSHKQNKRKDIQLINKKIGAVGFEPTIQESKSCALPLGYAQNHASWKEQDSNLRILS